MKFFHFLRSIEGQLIGGSILSGDNLVNTLYTSHIQHSKYSCLDSLSYNTDGITIWSVVTTLHKVIAMIYQGEIIFFCLI